MKIICIGRNYADHAKELNNPVPKEPLFFLKPDSAILPKGHAFFIPEWTKDVHFELELVFKINRLGKHIDQKFASKYYSQVGLGIDFTARDIQENCKQKGHPWEKAKAFDGSAVLSKKFVDLDQLPPLETLTFRLEKNGTVVQNGRVSDMIFKADALISYVSQFMTLKIGDLLFTGTPSGVGPVKIGDELRGFLDEKEILQVSVR